MTKPEPILTTEQHRELMRWSSPVIEGEVVHGECPQTALSASLSDHDTQQPGGTDAR